MTTKQSEKILNIETAIAKTAAKAIYEKATEKACNHMFGRKTVHEYVTLSDLKEICLSQEPEEEELHPGEALYQAERKFIKSITEEAKQEPPQDKGIDERAKQNYETKPVKVEAIQWTGTNTDTIEEWLKDYGCWLKKYVENGILAEDEMMLGVHLITHSNWVVRIRGDFIIESDEQFKNKYQRKVQEVSASQLMEVARKYEDREIGVASATELLQHLESYLKSQATRGDTE